MDDRAVASTLFVSHVRSIQEIDTLLLLRSESRRFTPQEVARSLKLSVREAEAVLHVLVTRGLASRTASGTRFELTDASLEPAVLALVRWNRVDRAELLVMMSREALSRFRSGAHFLVDTPDPKKR